MPLKWEDLPKKKSLFTVRNAVMTDLSTGKIVQHYSANTKIEVIQKCSTLNKTFYRTQSAAKQDLNWAFEASAFGLPNEHAPVAPDYSLKNTRTTQVRPLPVTEKQTSVQQVILPETGEARRRRVPFWKRLFRK